MALTDYSNFTFPNFNVPFPYQNLIQQLQASMQSPTPGSYGRFGGTGLMAGTPGGTGSQPPATPPGAVAPSGPTVGPPGFNGPGSGPLPPPYMPPPVPGNVGPPGFNGPGTTPPSPVNGSPMVKPLDSNLKMAQAPQQGLLGQSFTIGSQLDPRLANNPVGNRFIEKFNQMHPQLHVTAQDFNRVNAVNPGLAFQLASMGGQNYINSIMAQNGTNWDDMRQWINDTGYNNGGFTTRMTPENIALLRSLGIS